MQEERERQCAVRIPPLRAVIHPRPPPLLPVDFKRTIILPFQWGTGKHRFVRRTCADDRQLGEDGDDEGNELLCAQLHPAYNKNKKKEKGDVSHTVDERHQKV
jgi:hypothetical protein